tara:strand:- start:8044 stop:8802 length:759 start_codon:yes stop_codon:yes gene_type:complete
MNNNRRLVAVVACRNNGSRLFGKPLQNLDIHNNWKIIDQVIDNLKSCEVISQIVLAIAEGNDNLSYCEYANEKGLMYVVGDEIDVLDRLNKGLIKAKGTDLFRVTSESPFLYKKPIEEAWSSHKMCKNDATFLDGIIDGCGFEIINSKALKYSWENGKKKHRSEMCSLFIRENRNIFKIDQINCPKELEREDLRLTVDYPEDLIVCRYIFNNLIKDNDSYDLLDVVKYLDENPFLKNLIEPFCEKGYKTMYL